MSVSSSGLKVDLNNVILSILTASFIGFNGYLSAKFSSLEAKVSELQISVAEASANRFTSEDGLVVWKEISVIKQDISTLIERIRAVDDGNHWNNGVQP